MRFSEKLRRLRHGAGLSIKKLAPQLEVNYTYLSKLENDEVNPSAELVERVARYFGVPQDGLLLSAGKIPDEVVEILRNHPEEAIAILKEKFGRKALP
jgi:transcriptional regulator with XRE-family HTH domain